MLLDPIITALRTRCASFANRVQGAAQFSPAPATDTLAVPCAYVVAQSEVAEEVRARNDVRQGLTESFAVIVAVSTQSDASGLSAMTSLHALRTELWAALLGWQPSARHEGLIYQGGHLMSLDSQRLWWQFNFSAVLEIEPSDSWQFLSLAALQDFSGATFRVDTLDPSDPNASTTPDGRIGMVFSAEQGQGVFTTP
jgi:hypothetical protein